MKTAIGLLEMFEMDSQPNGGFDVFLCGGLHEAPFGIEYARSWDERTVQNDTTPLSIPSLSPSLSLLTVCKHSHMYSSTSSHHNHHYNYYCHHYHHYHTVPVPVTAPELVPLSLCRLERESTYAMYAGEWALPKSSTPARLNSDDSSSSNGVN